MDPAPAHGMALKTRFFLGAMLAVLGLDQASKLWIARELHYAQRIPLIDGLLDLTHVRNPGGAFSFFADGSFEHRMLFFIGTTIVAIIMLLVFLRRLEPDARLSGVAVGSILGGAVGNLIDRIVHGEVIDFIDVHLWGGYTWPTFNFADAFIVCGVAALMAEVFDSGRDPSPDGSASQEGRAAPR